MSEILKNENLPLYMFFSKPIGRLDNELWDASLLKTELKIHIQESPSSYASESFILPISFKLHEIGLMRGFDFMICLHKDDTSMQNFIVLHMTEEAFSKLKEQEGFKHLEITKEI